MKHFVNLSLLLFFGTLVLSGLFRFLKPFDLVTTRVHMVFGFGVLLLVGLHLASRGRYFAGLLRKRQASQGHTRHTALLFGGVLALWSVLLTASLQNWWPVNTIVSASYEARHQREIFRHNSRTAFETLDHGVQVKRRTDMDAGLRLELEWGPAFQPEPGAGQPLGTRSPQIAIWAEAEDGTILETLFVSQACAAAHEINWNGHPQSRRDILPIWYARFEELLGKEPAPEEIDAVSGATPTRNFSMERFLKVRGEPFSVYVEVNAPNDPNDFFHHDQDADNEGYTREGIGQPSVVYEAYIFPEDDRRYFLMDMSGHSGSTTRQSREVDYEMDELTTGKRIIEKILIQLQLPEASAKE